MESRSGSGLAGVVICSGGLRSCTSERAISSPTSVRYPGFSAGVDSDVSAICSVLSESSTRSPIGVAKSSRSVSGAGVCPSSCSLTTDSLVTACSWVVTVSGSASAGCAGVTGVVGAVARFIKLPVMVAGTTPPPIRLQNICSLNLTLSSQAAFSESSSSACQ